MTSSQILNIGDIQRKYYCYNIKEKATNAYQFIKNNLAPIVSLTSVIINIILLSLTIPNLRNDITQLSTQVPLIQMAISNFQSQLNPVTYSLSNLTYEIASSRSILSEVSGTYPSLLESVTAVATQVSNLNSNVALMNTQVPTLASDVIELRGNVNSTINLFEILIGDRNTIQNSINQVESSQIFLSQVNQSVVNLQSLLSPLNQTFVEKFVTDSNAFNKFGNFIEAANFVYNYSELLNMINSKITNLLTPNQIDVTLFLIHFYLGGIVYDYTYTISQYEPIISLYGVTGFYGKLISGSLYETLVTNSTVFWYINSILQFNVPRSSNCTRLSSIIFENGINFYYSLYDYTSSCTMLNQNLLLYIDSY
jgi:hypothetical protein